MNKHTPRYDQHTFLLNFPIFSLLLIFGIRLGRIWRKRYPLARWRMEADLERALILPRVESEDDGTEAIKTLERSSEDEQALRFTQV